MEPHTLQTYAEAQVRAGASKANVLEQLIAVGWSEDEADKAYADALVAAGVPVPSDGTRGTHARRASTLEVVLNFFSFILMGIVASALGTLYFQIINKYFPDTLAEIRYYTSNMDTDAVYYAMAALIVAYPCYYLVVRMWFKRFREDEARVESKLTKWLTYLVLLVASVTIVGDLIVLLFTFFQGELSARFFLKSFVILLIAGMVFGFYYLERKKVQYRQEIPRHTFQLFGYVLTGLVLIGVVLGFIAAGSPATERMRTFDQNRANDLNSLARCVSEYAQQFERFPVALSDLGSVSRNYSYCDTNDPETNIAYEYRVTKPLTKTSTGLLEGAVELCAVFSLPSSDDSGGSYYYGNEKWTIHPAGRACDIESISVRAPTQ